MKYSTPWLKSAAFDVTFILSPALLAVAFVFFYSNSLSQSSGDVPLWAWLLFVVGVDVSHVYSTLFRTYFNSNEWSENKTLFTVIPLATWLAGVFLYAISSVIFWRVLAYVAVFHFIRQQYGFLRLYTRVETTTQWARRIDKLTIYTLTLYPIVYWHSQSERNFHWFVDGDFLMGWPPLVAQIASLFYICVVALYVSTEIYKVYLHRSFNIPKNLVVLGTGASWYVGIVLFNADMIFTITNVIAHGIPYMALVWLYGARQKEKSTAPLLLGRFSYAVFFSNFSVILFLAALLGFAYIEEGLWAHLVWREHLAAFPTFSFLPEISEKDTLTWLVPLLTLPQATHYILDGFIWKLKPTPSHWQQVFFNKENT